MMGQALSYMALSPGTPMHEIGIDAAYIGSCTNARLSDLQEAAKILQGRKVAAGVQAVCVPGSSTVKQAAEAEGVQEMVPDGVELLAGIWRDSCYGLVVTVGFGGTLVELLADSAHRIPPFGTETARAMLGELRGHPILGGLRGRPARDLSAIADLLARLSWFCIDFPEFIDELDLNPVICLGEGSGCRIVEKEGSGFAMAMESLANGRLALSPSCIGAADRLLEMGVSYSKVRTTFGKPLAARQAIQWMLADSATELAAGRALTYHIYYSKRTDSIVPKSTKR